MEYHLVLLFIHYFHNKSIIIKWNSKFNILIIINFTKIINSWISNINTIITLYSFF